MTRLISMTAFMLLLATPALAHNGHHHARFHRRHSFAHRAYLARFYAHHSRHQIGAREAAITGEITVRPSDCYGIPWCGCYMRHVLHIASDAFNLARHWLAYGHATTAHAGAVVVWPHHVGLIKAVDGGRALVLSGNDGHAVRERWRSLRGAIGFREG